MKRLFPREPLVLVCRPGFGQFFLEHKLVDEVFELNKKDKAAMHNTMAQLEQRQWNYIVCPHESPRTALLLRSLKANKKVAFKKWWNAWFFDQTLAKPYALPDALRQLSLLALIHADFKKQFNNFIATHQIVNPNSKTNYTWSFGELPEWASLSVKVNSDTLSLNNTVVLAPGSVWNTKRWTLDGYAKVAEHFIKNQFQVVLIGTKQEQDICEQIAQKVKGVENKAGQTSLSQLYTLLKNAQVLFCNDSGAMHLAAAAGTPTVSGFGPTVLAQGFMPWNEHSVVVQKTLTCRPCGRHGSEKCPIGTHECMQSIEAVEVLHSYEGLQKRLN